MDAILKTIFIALDEEQGRAPEMGAALNAAEPVFAAAREKLSCAEFDRVWTAAMNIGTADVEHCFALGFRAGARLMLEALREA